MVPANTLKKLSEGKNVTLVGFGDSLTRGWMTRKGYLDFFGEMLARKYPSAGISILNRGLPGDTAEASLYRISGDVVDHDPDIVLIQFGLNDAFAGVTPHMFRGHIEMIVQTIKNDSSAEAALLTSVFILDQAEYRYALEYYEVLERVAASEKIPLVPVHRYWEDAVKRGADHRSLLQWDGVHPTVEGYLLMAEAVFGLFSR